MSEYHVGCNSKGIYVGTRTKNGESWITYSNVTYEALSAVAKYLMLDGNPYQFEKDGNSYLMQLSIINETPSEDLSTWETIKQEIRKEMESDYISGFPPYKKCLDIIDKHLPKPPENKLCSLLDDDCAYPTQQCWECKLHYAYMRAKAELKKLKGED